jgi:hypothetical protein
MAPHIVFLQETVPVLLQGVLLDVCSNVFSAQWGMGSTEAQHTLPWWKDWAWPSYKVACNITDVNLLE